MVVALLICGIVFFIVYRRRKNKSEKNQTQTTGKHNTNHVPMASIETDTKSSSTTTAPLTLEISQYERVPRLLGQEPTEKYDNVPKSDSVQSIPEGENSQYERVPRLLGQQPTERYDNVPKVSEIDASNPSTSNEKNVDDGDHQYERVPKLLGQESTERYDNVPQGSNITPPQPVYVSTLGRPKSSIHSAQQPQQPDSQYQTYVSKGGNNEKEITPPHLPSQYQTFMNSSMKGNQTKQQQPDSQYQTYVSKDSGVAAGGPSQYQTFLNNNKTNSQNSGTGSTSSAHSANPENAQYQAFMNKEMTPPQIYGKSPNLPPPEENNQYQFFSAKSGPKPTPPQVYEKTPTSRPVSAISPPVDHYAKLDSTFFKDPANYEQVGNVSEKRNWKFLVFYLLLFIVIY